MSVTPTPHGSEVTHEDRRALLAQAVAQHVHDGYRVESQTDFQAIVVKGRRPNHLLHFFLGVFTITLWWLFVWLPLALFGGEKRRVLTVDNYGQLAVRKGSG